VWAPGLFRPRAFFSLVRRLGGPTLDPLVATVILPGDPPPASGVIVQGLLTDRGAFVGRALDPDAPAAPAPALWVRAGVLEGGCPVSVYRTRLRAERVATLVVPAPNIAGRPATRDLAALRGTALVLLE